MTRDPGDLAAAIDAYTDRLVDEAPPLDDDDVAELRAILHPRIPRPPGALERHGLTIGDGEEPDT